MSGRHLNVAAVVLANKNAGIVWDWLARDHGFRSEYTPTPHAVPLRAQLGQGGLHVKRVPQNDHVEHQVERAKLIFLAFTVVPA